MARLAKNDTQLLQMLMPELKVVVDYLVQKIWNENREIVRLVVYESYLPVEYERTKQFKEAWGTEVNMTKNVVEGKFKYDPRLLTVNPEKGQHSSITYGGPKNEEYTYLAEDEPMTTYLADIIYQGLAGDFTGEYKYAYQNPKFKGQEWTKKRDAWRQLQKTLGSRLLKQWMKEGFERAGLKVKAYNTSWGKIEW